MSASDSLALPPAPLSKRAWRAIIGLGLTQIIGYGTTYYLLGLMGEVIRADLGLSSTVLLSGVAITLLASAVFGPAAGRWQDQLGSNVPMALGSILMGIGLLILSRAEDSALYFVGWSFIALGSPTSLYSACFTALAHMAGRNARKAIIYLTLIGGLASSIVWPITAWLMTVMDWRAIVLLFGGLNILLCAPLHALLLDGKKAHTEVGASPEKIPPGLPQQAQMRAFILLTTMLAVISLVGNAWSMLVFPVLAGLGFTFKDAVLIASLVGIFQVLGRIGELVSSSKHSPLRTAEISNLLYLTGFVMLIVWKGAFFAGIIFAAAYGAANGLNTIVKGTLTLAIFGSHGYGERLGKVTLIPGISAAIGPMLGGFIIEKGGAIALVFGFSACSFIAFALMVLLTRHCRTNGLN